MRVASRIFSIVILISFVCGIVSCADRKQKEIKIEGVPEGYFEKWEYFTVDSEIVKEKAKEFFGGREYKAIWKWDTDGDGKIDYLLIEPHPKIVKGIKGGILIGEDGEVKLIIDRNKGIYTPEYMIDDFKRGGIEEGEVECIRLLFYRNKGDYSMEFTKENKERIKRTQKVFAGEVGTLIYSLIDKDLKEIVSDWISKMYNSRIDKIEYILYDYLGGSTEEEFYKRRKKSIKKYLLDKSTGKLADILNFNPDNPEEVSNYIKSLKSKQEGK